MRMLLLFKKFQTSGGVPPGNLKRLWDAFMDIVPNLIGAIIVFVIGYLVAKIIHRILKRLLKTIGVDKLGDKLNEIDVIQDNDLKIVPSTLLAKIFYYIVLLFVTVAATEVLQVKVISDLMANLLQFTPNIIVALILMAVGLLVGDTVKGVVQTACESFNIPSAKLIGNAFFFLILVIALVSALGQIQIETNFIITVITIILGGIVLAFSIGYGLASKDQMANFMASRQNADRFNIGDVIAVGGEKGEIIDIDNSTVTLQSKEKDEEQKQEKSKTVIIPLRKLSSEKVEIFES